MFRHCDRNGKAQAEPALDRSNHSAVQTIAMQQLSAASHSPSALASRFTEVAHKWVADGPAERAEVARRKLLAAVDENEPATLNQVAIATDRGAPAVSRSIDALVRAGLVERQPDPGNRRRLALRLTGKGREEMRRNPSSGGALRAKFERLAHSELRAVERAIEILERGL